MYPAAAGFFSAITIIITWTMNNQESNAKKGMGMTILNVIGQCGPLIGRLLSLWLASSCSADGENRYTTLP